jgi:hypothetical protein
MKNTFEVSDTMRKLEADPWRIDRPFSPDMATCHGTLFDPRKTRHQKADAMSDWLAESQPCLFGRMEAKLRRLAFCILTENDLERSDQAIREQIQQSRTAWGRRALLGDSHGFLIVAVSPAIAFARPGPALRDLALTICNLYLGIARLDEILHDHLILGVRRSDCGSTEWRRWPVGVNFFSSQGDGRWWHDHRIPGGMAFSMNSVGHMARAKVEREIGKDPGRARRAAEVPREKLVYWALPTAMKTIGPPQTGSIRGTWLAPHGSYQQDREPPTFEQRQRYFDDLAQYSPNGYKGRYHTDHTVPSSYFDEGVWRSEDIPVRDDLFFTYLHAPSDVDYLSMGVGLTVTGAEAARGALPGQNKE